MTRPSSPSGHPPSSPLSSSSSPSMTPSAGPPPHGNDSSNNRAKDSAASAAPYIQPKSPSLPPLPPPSGRGDAEAVVLLGDELAHQRRAIADLRQALDGHFDASIMPPPPETEKRSEQGVASTAHAPTIDAPSPDATKPPVRRRRRVRRRSTTTLSWSLVWIVITAAFAGVGVFAFRWMTSLPPNPDCRTLSPLSADAMRLHCANVAAESGGTEDILNGLDLVRSWDNTHPLFWKAQHMLEPWTKQMLAVAEAALYGDSLDRAIELLDAVPDTSPLYEQVQTVRAEWQALWANGETIEQTALDAVQAEQWDVAAKQVVALGQIEHDYWRQERANELSLRIVAERQGQATYESAKAMATAAAEPEQLAEAMAQLQTIHPQTFVWQSAQTELVQWSQTIAEASLERFQAGDRTGAIALAQALPADPEVMPEATDLLQVGYAHRQAIDDPANLTPGLAEFMGLSMALSTAAQLPTDSVFYDHVQTQLPQWQQQLQDLSQVYMAEAIASTGHGQAMAVAADQLKLVEPGQPRRVQAQTLIAHWRLEQERIEDRPQLNQARYIAKAGTVEALNQAIAQAQTISPDRALRRDADAAIAEWVGQIQTIEDQPILNQAVALAEAGDLNGAIAQANQIANDRALHAAAQEKVGQWQATLTHARFRAALASARSLAGRVRLTEAINVASSITPSHPALYQEAQSAIAQWRRERDRIVAARSRPARSSRPSPSPSPAASPRSSPAPARSSFEGYYDSRYYDYRD